MCGQDAMEQAREASWINGFLCGVLIMIPAIIFVLLLKIPQ